MKYTLIVFIVLAIFSCKVNTPKTAVRIICYESTKEDFEYSDVLFIKTCEFNNHLFKVIGTPDYKGRYSNNYEVFKISTKDTLRIKNVDFFNHKVYELEKIINKKLKATYDANSKIPEISDCMKSIDFRYYTLNEFGISFTPENNIEFNLEYSIGGACFNVSSSAVVMEFSELEHYLN